MAVRVARAEAEEARAALLAAVPEGFEERDAGEAVELVAYVERGTEGRVVARFGAATVDPVELGWEDGWRAFHRPARIGELWVGPPWEQSDPDAVAVVIDPGRAFGTGAHPTTRLCLELLQELSRGSLVDLGCGSGVVAIAAAKLGFAPVLALDVDLAAVEVTRDNAAANRVAVDARHADVVADPIPAVDVAVANVSLPVVAAVAPRVRARRLVTSGYRSDDHVQLPRWRVVAQRQSDGWAAHAFAPVPR